MRRITTTVLTVTVLAAGSASAEPLLTEGNWKQRLSSRTGSAAPVENLYFRCFKPGVPDPMPRLDEIAGAQGCRLARNARLTQTSLSGSDRMTCTQMGTTLTVTYAGDPRTRFTVTYRYEGTSDGDRASKTDVYEFIRVAPTCE